MSDGKKFESYRTPGNNIDLIFFLEFASHADEHTGHPLAALATRIPWASIEAALAPVFERRAREGR